MTTGSFRSVRASGFPVISSVAAATYHAFRTNMLFPPVLVTAGAWILYSVWNKNSRRFLQARCLEPRIFFPNGMMMPRNTFHHQGYVPYLLRRITDTLIERFTAGLKPHGITLPMWRILAVL